MNTPLLSPSSVTLMGGTSPVEGIVDLHGGEDRGYANFCGLMATNTLLCWGYEFQPYPTAFGVSNVVALGGTGYYIRYLTSDGMYHVGTVSDHVGTARTPSCGLLH